MVIGLVEKGIPFPVSKKHKKKCWKCKRATEFIQRGKACDYGRAGKVKTLQPKDIACSMFLE